MTHRDPLRADDIGSPRANVASATCAASSPSDHIAADKNAAVLCDGCYDASHRNHVCADACPSCGHLVHAAELACTCADDDAPVTLRAMRLEARS